ncbi:hypothetical protein HRR83_007168 [Exophiala dermatitidis]|uniref:Thiol methyltransferase n=2 Tax=Exophiala dermatitidis TaxID=5970 RepID=H6C4H9_EXODN|nr:uncharacterized protein HMPREF1120_06472 [Exophiala dermatitidis NIH/UT8656]KAJ4509148.1 hypothetical protein HRR75_006117 [Exophiala dermatitidis]EHY58462.1 hypothetical protein HMPREF1120_06472 [Exophiala dermatitidis NIH/UT8656]KAJ4511127.1 hypothetical protein HRR73_006460 [Exophiala dermatitidis]KAJ4511938.1 hypothetical protein HRR74_006672 [Exophiala dermatitidis]KAJ4545774.1 hypothetical protein HRR78_006048 [Exophiala dermatitidis]
MSSSDSKPQRRDLPVEEARAELKRHFAEFSGSKYADGWAALWSKGEFLPWDRNAPSPALPDTLINHADVVGNALVVDEESNGDGQPRRKRALVPGCGRGVDVVLLQSFGYDAVGLEYAADAVKAAEEYAQQHADDYPVHDEKFGKGSIKFVQGDFYSDDWLEKAGLPKDGKFDLIYDYTFFCAMEPRLRPAWAKRMTELLRHSPQANLICLEFPTNKPASLGGPPFASPPKAYLEHLSHPGEEVKYDAEGEVRLNPLAPSSPGALERVGHWHPADTHQVGKDADGNVLDYIAVWRHR